eukprot:TRINITY_DN1657_c0_g1_i1.p1 TRINITY_DN1657_c0_g1~~TRINITY_DN1657_c0_g1_i1.p1  ORF type:complete len:359 (+),score=19.79 TRINITY_DN1657_c0_g1_i1:26-1078(+)
MEHEYFNYDIVPSDIWRLIFKQFQTLTDLRSFNSINKSCHNYSKYYLQKEKLWLGLFKSRFGLVETQFTPSLLPSKLFRIKQMLRPSLNINKNNINFDGPLKIVVVGDGGIGKTSYTKLVSGDHVDKRYIPTIGVEVHKIEVKSSKRNFQLTLWDTAGPEKFGGLRDGYYIGAAGAIILSDVTSLYTIKNVPNWHRDVMRVCGDIPIAVCGNKVDQLPEGASSSNLVRRFIRLMTFAKKKNTMFCEISNYAKFGVHEPLIWILQQLTGDDTLELTFPPLNGTVRGKINSKIFDAAMAARGIMLRYQIDINVMDEFEDIVDRLRRVPRNDSYHQQKRQVLTCSYLIRHQSP